MEAKGVKGDRSELGSIRSEGGEAVVGGEGADDEAEDDSGPRPCERQCHLSKSSLVVAAWTQRG